MSDVVPARRILIVEDEAPIRQMLAFNLKRAGFAVDEAEDCATARRQIVDANPDLVLIDWMLPDTSGLELTRSLRRDEANRELILDERHVEHRVDVIAVFGIAARPEHHLG